MTTITNEEQLAVDQARATHEEQRLVALEQHLGDLFAEIRSAVLGHPTRVPYVEHALYGNDAPEEWLEGGWDRVRHAAEALRQRVDRVVRIVNAWSDEPEDQPSDPKHWDAMRIQKRGTHDAAVALLTETARLVFALDQYASAKYLWRNETHVD